MILTETQSPRPIRAIGYDIQKLSDEQTSLVKKLLDLNHVNYSILYNNGRFHNHSPHFLGSAYMYGGSSKYLQEIYDDLVFRDNLESWKPSPGEITLDNYRARIGKAEYQRAWVDFFEGQMREQKTTGDWSDVVTKFLFDKGPSGETNATPMFQCLNAALGHPLIHLGYAYELNAPELAAEALGLVATCYDEHLACLITKQPASAVALIKPTSNLVELFELIHNDDRLPAFSQPGDEHIEVVLSNSQHVDVVVAYVDAWQITNPTQQLMHIYYFASLLLVSTAPHLSGDGFDFFLVHMLTTAHALRVLLPHLPREHHETLLKEWLLIAALAYIAQKRPKLNTAYVKDLELKGRDWEYVRQRAIGSKYSTDAHYVKACRALRVAFDTWKDNDDVDWFLRCAVRFVSEFDGWGGFDIEAKDATLVKQQRKKDGIYVR